MNTIRAFIKSHPLLSYFALAFAITWCGFVLAVGPGGIPATKEQFTTLPLGAILAVLVGPSVSGILLTGLFYGREGFRSLFTRMRRWRVGARWYAVALLTAPLVFTAVLLPLSLISPVFRLGIFASDAKVSFVLMNIVVGLIVGIFEELGWTGFAVPTLLKLRYGVLSTGLMVGVYERTGSLLLAMLMHASYAASTFILNPVVGPGAMSGAYLLAYVIAS